MLPGGCIFLTAVDSFGRGRHEMFIYSRSRLTRLWCFRIF
jgi:hypothetical protein